MQIGELAHQTGATVRSIRHYEAAGLLHSLRLPNGYRDFQLSAVTRVRNIKALLDVGLTLDDVADFECCLDGDVTTAAPSPNKLAVAQRRLAQLQQRRDELAAACERLETALKPPGRPRQ